MTTTIPKQKRILIFNVNWIGDVLFSTATIRNIRRNYPDAFIACIVPSRCYQVLKDNPYLDEILIYDEKDRHRRIWDKLQFVHMLRQRRFDTVYLLHRSFTRALICRLADIPERVGYVTGKRAFLLTKRIIPPSRHSLHRIDYYLKLIEEAGLKVEDRYLDFYFSDADEDKVNAFLKEKGVLPTDTLVVASPAGNWLAKRWPKQHWAYLADCLIERYAMKVVFCGSLSDRGLLNDLTLLMRNPAILAAGVFNLKQVGALCRRADLFISADTGPLHIANAVGAKKIIALFGPTSPFITGPFPDKNVLVLRKDVGCRLPCYNLRCRDNRCMKQISPQEVLEHILTMLNINK